MMKFLLILACDPTLGDSSETTPDKEHLARSFGSQKLRGDHLDQLVVPPSPAAARTGQLVLFGARARGVDTTTNPDLDGGDETVETVCRELIEGMPVGGRFLTVVSAAYARSMVKAVTGHDTAPLGPCEGVEIAVDANGRARIHAQYRELPY